MTLLVAEREAQARLCAECRATRSDVTRYRWSCGLRREARAWLCTSCARRYRAILACAAGGYFATDDGRTD